MAEKIQIVCSTCGSANVRRDAWAEWQPETQEWVLGSVFDNGDCEVCEGESRLEEVAFEDWERSLDGDHELRGVERHGQRRGGRVGIHVEQTVGPVRDRRDDGHATGGHLEQHSLRVD